MSTYWKIGHTPQEAERIISERNKTPSEVTWVRNVTRAWLQQALKNHPQWNGRTWNKKSGG